MDPDELAIMVCALLMVHGQKPTLVMRRKGEMVHGIEVHVDEKPVAIFPTSPFVMTEQMTETLARAMEADARRVAVDELVPAGND